MATIHTISREQVLKRKKRKREEAAVEVMNEAMEPDRQEWFVQYLAGETELLFDEWRSARRQEE